MIDNGFDSVHSLLALKVDIDLDQIPDILLGQKSILRESILDLQKQYKQLGLDSKKDNSFTRSLLEKSLFPNEESAPKTPNNTSNITLDDSPPKKKSTQKVSTKLKEKKKVVQTIDRRMDSPDSQSVTVAEKFGLRSANKKHKKSVEEPNEESFHVNEPEVQIIVAEGVDGQSCDACERPGKRQFPNGVLCSPCLYFHDYNISNKKQLICESDDNCLITKNNKNNCRSCRMSKITAIMSDTNGVPNDSIGQTSGEDNGLVEDLDQSIGQYLRFYSFILCLIFTDFMDSHMESSELVTTSQPFINLTPIKVKRPSKRLSFSQKKKNKKNCCGICKVCGDVSKGQNYGIESCSGCAVFFKRVFSGERVTGDCVKGDNSCSINLINRNKCRFCRYQTCMRSGMVAISAQNERKEGEFPEEGEALNQREEESDRNEELMDNTFDVSPSTGFDYASIHCGRTPETPIRGNRRKPSK